MEIYGAFICNWFQGQILSRINSVYFINQAALCLIHNNIGHIIETYMLAVGLEHCQAAFYRSDGGSTFSVESGVI